MEYIDEALLEQALNRDACLELKKPEHNLFVKDIIYGKEYSYFLILKSCPEIIINNDSEAIGQDGIFYNKYLWFKRFIKKYTDNAGFDAGLEQQAYKLLEEASMEGVDIDWELVESIDSETE